MSGDNVCAVRLPTYKNLGGHLLPQTPSPTLKSYVIRNLIALLFDGNLSYIMSAIKAEASGLEFIQQVYI